MAARRDRIGFLRFEDRRVAGSATDRHCVMPQVIDTFEHRTSGRVRIPEFDGDGLVAILDPEQIHSTEQLAGTNVRVQRPDGSLLNRNVTASTVRHGVVALFFSGAGTTDVPRGSLVTWNAA